jgi:uncharacterized Zn finger protein
MSYWDSFPTPKPRRESVDGVKARSRRGSIGESWWSRRFIEALESFTDPNRLKRGRSYARSGQVTGLEVEAGLVTALVQGSRRKPYKVSIRVPRLDDAEWAAAEQAMAAQAIFLASLLAGEMPDQVEEAFSTAGVPLFPTSHADLDTRCSCPDYANPCKHTAATLYILAEAFDDDPFLIFAWRGRGKEELLGNLRDPRSAHAGDTDGEGRPDGESEDEVEAVELPTSAAAFWRGEGSLDEMHYEPRAPDQAAAVLLQLGPPPLALRGAATKRHLEELYARITVGGERLARRGDREEADIQLGG